MITVLASESGDHGRESSLIYLILQICDNKINFFSIQKKNVSKEISITN